MFRERARPACRMRAAFVLMPAIRGAVRSAAGQAQLRGAGTVGGAVASGSSGSAAAWPVRWLRKGAVVTGTRAWERRP
jgi:hypothetical protein